MALEPSPDALATKAKLIGKPVSVLVSVVADGDVHAQWEKLPKKEELAQAKMRKANLRYKGTNSWQK
jgi:hypothetical protein